jgi:hypothetical protein
MTFSYLITSLKDYLSFLRRCSCIKSKEEKIWKKLFMNPKQAFNVKGKITEIIYITVISHIRWWIYNSNRVVHHIMLLLTQNYCQTNLRVSGQIIESSSGHNYLFVHAFTC